MNIRSVIIGTALLATAHAAVVAQTLRPALDYASAATIRETCLAWAGERGMKAAIAVRDPRGMLVAYAHLDGTSTAAGEAALWKSDSASRFGAATADLAKLNPPANMPAVATIRGGVPIYTKDGVLLGGVGVSGMKSEDDAACASAGIEAAGLVPARP
ncbi:GlcG/HbpS family heme-binding protein [Novosphingobium aquimarinum]|uniref:GlcG/HbpS family heme-binding protein n=1 Tax=Novosphingobium aquimarinum TaxID=2682494 RepID=UPI0012EBB84D|nr:heme-binding protein [Novosphingobium aquimarinum]